MKLITSWIGVLCVTIVKYCGEYEFKLGGNYLGRYLHEDYLMERIYYRRWLFWVLIVKLVSAIVLSVLMVLFVVIILRPLTGSGFCCVSIWRCLLDIMSVYLPWSVSVLFWRTHVFAGECNYADRSSNW